MKKNVSKEKMLYLCGFLCIAACTAMILILFSPRETYESTPASEKSRITSLVCQSGEPKDVFFTIENSLSKQYEIKTSFSGDKISKIMFNLSATYASDDDASNANSRMLASYNIYMSSNGIKEQKYYPNFRSDKGNVILSLSSSMDELTSPFVHVAISKSIDLPSIANKTHSELIKDYEAVGYSCEYSE